MPPRLIILAALALVLPATASLAGRLPEPPKDLKICRTPATSLGTRIRKGTRCRTAQQWHDEEAAQVNVPASLRVVGRDKPQDKPSPY